MSIDIDVFIRTGDGDFGYSNIYENGSGSIMCQNYQCRVTASDIRKYLLDDTALLDIVESNSKSYITGCLSVDDAKKEIMNFWTFDCDSVIPEKTIINFEDIDGSVPLYVREYKGGGK